MDEEADDAVMEIEFGLSPESLANFESDIDKIAAGIASQIEPGLRKAWNAATKGLSIPDFVKQQGSISSSLIRKSITDFPEGQFHELQAVMAKMIREWGDEKLGSSWAKADSISNKMKSSLAQKVMATSKYFSDVQKDLNAAAGSILSDFGKEIGAKNPQHGMISLGSDPGITKESLKKRISSFPRIKDADKKFKLFVDATTWAYYEAEKELKDKLISQDPMVRESAKNQLPILAGERLKDIAGKHYENLVGGRGKDAFESIGKSRGRSLDVQESERALNAQMIREYQAKQYREAKSEGMTPHEAFARATAAAMADAKSVGFASEFAAEAMENSKLTRFVQRKTKERLDAANKSLSQVLFESTVDQAYANDLSAMESARYQKALKEARQKGIYTTGPAVDFEKISDQQSTSTNIPGSLLELPPYVTDEEKILKMARRAGRLLREGHADISNRLSERHIETIFPGLRDLYRGELNRTSVLSTSDYKKSLSRARSAAELSRLGHTEQSQSLIDADRREFTGAQLEVYDTELQRKTAMPIRTLITDEEKVLKMARRAGRLSREGRSDISYRLSERHVTSISPELRDLYRDELNRASSIDEAEKARYQKALKEMANRNKHSSVLIDSSGQLLGQQSPRRDMFGRYLPMPPEADSSLITDEERALKMARRAGRLSREGHADVSGRLSERHLGSISPDLEDLYRGELNRASALSSGDYRMALSRARAAAELSRLGHTTQSQDLIDDDRREFTGARLEVYDAELQRRTTMPIRAHVDPNRQGRPAEKFGPDYSYQDDVGQSVSVPSLTDLRNRFSNSAISRRLKDAAGSLFGPKLVEALVAERDKILTEVAAQIPYNLRDQYPQFKRVFDAARNSVAGAMDKFGPTPGDEIEEQRRARVKSFYQGYTGSITGDQITSDEKIEAMQMARSVQQDRVYSLQALYNSTPENEVKLRDQIDERLRSARNHLTNMQTAEAVILPLLKERLELETAIAAARAKQQQNPSFGNERELNRLQIELDKNRSKESSVLGGGGRSNKNLSQAMLQASYGIQDFFQVTAQPGMGPMRGLLAAANNIAPALMMMNISSVGANIAIAGLLSGMTALNVLTEKNDKSLKEFTDTMNRHGESASRTSKMVRDLRSASASTTGSRLMEMVGQSDFDIEGNIARRDRLQADIETKDWTDLEKPGNFAFELFSDLTSSLGAFFGDIYRGTISGEGYSKYRPVGSEKKFQQAQRIEQLLRDEKFWDGIEGVSDPSYWLSAYGTAKPGMMDKVVEDRRKHLNQLKESGVIDEYMNRMKEMEDRSSFLKMVKSRASDMPATTLKNANYAFSSGNPGLFESIVGDVVDQYRKSPMVALSAQNNLEAFDSGSEGERLKNAISKADRTRKELTILKKYYGNVGTTKEEDFVVEGITKNFGGDVEAAISAYNFKLSDEMRDVEARQKQRQLLVDEAETTKSLEEASKKSLSAIVKSPMAGSVVMSKIDKGFDSGGELQSLFRAKEIQETTKAFNDLWKEMGPADRAFLETRNSIRSLGDELGSQVVKIQNAKNKIAEFGRDTENSPNKADLRARHGLETTVGLGKSLGFELKPQERDQRVLFEQYNRMVSFVGELERRGTIQPAVAENLRSGLGAEKLRREMDFVSQDPLIQKLSYVNEFSAAVLNLGKAIQQGAMLAKQSGTMTEQQGAWVALNSQLKAAGFSVRSLADELQAITENEQLLKDQVRKSDKLSNDEKKSAIEMIETQSEAKRQTAMWSSMSSGMTREARGGYLEDHIYKFGDKKVTGKQLNFEDAMLNARQKRDEDLAKIDLLKMGDQEKETARKAVSDRFNKQMAQEVDRMIPKGRNRVMTEGMETFHRTIQESLTTDPAEMLEEKQVKLLEEILKVLTGQKGEEIKSVLTGEKKFDEASKETRDWINAHPDIKEWFDKQIKKSVGVNPGERDKNNPSQKTLALQNQLKEAKAAEDTAKSNLEAAQQRKKSADEWVAADTKRKEAEDQVKNFDHEDKRIDKELSDLADVENKTIFGGPGGVKTVTPEELEKYGISVDENNQFKHDEAKDVFKKKRQALLEEKRKNSEARSAAEKHAQEAKKEIPSWTVNAGNMTPEQAQTEAADEVSKAEKEVSSAQKNRESIEASIEASEKDPEIKKRRELEKNLQDARTEEENAKNKVKTAQQKAESTAKRFGDVSVKAQAFVAEEREATNQIKHFDSEDERISKELSDLADVENKALFGGPGGAKNVTPDELKKYGISVDENGTFDPGEANDIFEKKRQALFNEKRKNSEARSAAEKRAKEADASFEVLVPDIKDAESEQKQAADALTSAEKEAAEAEHRRKAAEASIRAAEEESKKKSGTETTSFSRKGGFTPKFDDSATSIFGREGGFIPRFDDSGASALASRIGDERTPISIERMQVSLEEKLDKQFDLWESIVRDGIPARMA